MIEEALGQIIGLSLVGLMICLFLLFVLVAYVVMR